MLGLWHGRWMRSSCGWIFLLLAFGPSILEPYPYLRFRESQIRCQNDPPHSVEVFSGSELLLQGSQLRRGECRTISPLALGYECCRRKMLKMIHENEKINATYVLVDSRPESRPEESKHIRSAVKWNSINIQLYTKQFTNSTMKKIFFNSPRLKNTGPSPIRSLKFHCSPSWQQIFLGLLRINHCIQHSQKTFFKWNCIVASGVPEVITPSIIHPFSLFFC